MRRPARAALLTGAIATLFALSGCGEKDEPSPSATVPAIVYSKTGAALNATEIIHISPNNALSVTWDGKPADASNVTASMVLSARANVASIDFGALDIPRSAPAIGGYEISLTYGQQKTQGPEAQLIESPQLKPAIESLDAIAQKVPPPADGGGSGGSGSGSGSK